MDEECIVERQLYINVMNMIITRSRIHSHSNYQADVLQCVSRMSSIERMKQRPGERKNLCRKTLGEETREKVSREPTVRC